LQGIFPTESRLIAKQTTVHPSLAAASAASMPAWPAPMTAISYFPARYSIDPNPSSCQAGAYYKKLQFLKRQNLCEDIENYRYLRFFTHFLLFK
jgi:hypothetical protein